MFIYFAGDNKTLVVPDDPQAVDSFVNCLKTNQRVGQQEAADGSTVFDSKEVVAVVIGDFPEDLYDRAVAVGLPGKADPLLFPLHHHDFEKQQKPQIRPDLVFKEYLRDNKAAFIFQYDRLPFRLAIDMRKAVFVRYIRTK
jgi:hypothetical protein